MTFKLIDAELAVAMERAEAIRFKLKDCRSEPNAAEFKLELQKELDRIDDLLNKKTKLRADVVCSG